MASRVSITRHDYSIFYPVTSRWLDNDIYGHINNVTYYSYFDTAANTFLVKHCGLDIHNGEMIALVVSSGCEYLEPISFPDNIEVGVRIDRLGNSSVQYGLAIFKGKDPEACAFGQFIHVFVDRLSKKPMSIPPGMRERMKKITKSVAG